MARELLPYQIVERSIIEKYRKQFRNPFIAAVKRYALVEPGDKIVVCISGSKNSMLMAKLFQELHRHSDVPSEVTYLMMDPGYNEMNRAEVESNIKFLNILITVFETDIFGVTSNVDEHSCYFCARMCRGYLHRKVKDLGRNKIALGHHLNDVIEAATMAMSYSSRLQGVMSKLHSQNSEGMELIRPTHYIREGDVIAWRRYNEPSLIQCACRFTENCTICDNGGGGGKRQEVKILLCHLKQTNPDIEKSIFNAIYAVCTKIFPGIWKSDGDHNFLEDYEARRGE